MAGFAISLIKPLLDSTLAGTAANGIMGMNKTDEGIKVLGEEKKILSDRTKVLGDGTKTSSEKKVEKIEKEPKYKTLSRSEESELMLILAEGGLSTRELIEVMKTGFVSNDQLKRLTPELRRKLSRITGQDLEAQLGLGGPDTNGDDNDDENDKDKKNKEKKEKLRKLKKDAEDEQLEWKKKEAEFQRNDPKSKRMSDAKKALEKSRSEAPTRIDKKDPKYLSNSAEQKMEMGEERMKQAFENGTGSEWEYQHVTPRSNLPLRP